METMKNQVLTYLKAKDENKPNLMSLVFCSDVVLQMNVQSQNIDFPSLVQGLENVSSVLVKDFSNNYEDVYSICFSKSVKVLRNELKVAWFVCMRDKKTQQIKCGFGWYTWDFSSKYKVKKLIIDIEQMDIYDASFSNDIFAWMNEFDTKWLNNEIFLKAMPKLEISNSLKSFLFKIA